MGNCIFSSAVEPILLEKHPKNLNPKNQIEIVEIVTSENKQQGPDQVSDLRIKIPATNIDAS
jgi:hypothetical protein